MKKNILSIQKEICAAGLRLSKEGLVARSWGNISIRIDEHTMAVTPSGIKYEDVKPEHIAIINLADGTYQCEFKPSGERKLHIAVYRARPEVGAIIHTHQMAASVCAAVRATVPVDAKKAQSVLGADAVYCGAYGLPGTKKLTSQTVAAIKGGNSALMANHGVVCLGTDMAAAFNVAKVLEEVCSGYILKAFGLKTGTARPDDKAMCAYFERTHLQA